jgi:glycosyltransferase involved in cell wall biosynthesis
MTASPGSEQARPLISVVTPAFNEADNLGRLYARLAAVFDANVLAWEWIVVDDHSADATFSVLSELAGRDRRVTGLRLARNVGSHAAIRCGLANAAGDAAIVLAGDGQDPPEDIPRLIAEWRRGPAVVWAESNHRGSGRWHDDIGSRAFHRIMRGWSRLDNLARAGSDFFLVARPVIDELNALGERNSNVMALLAWIGFEQTSISYDKSARIAGRTGWTLRKKLDLSFDSIIGFSLRPIRAMSVIGLSIALLGLLYVAAMIVGAALGRANEGWQWLLAAVAVLGGMQMAMLGVLGEYLWRALDESRNRPGYVIERRTDARMAKPTAACCEQDGPT